MDTPQPQNFVARHFWKIYLLSIGLLIVISFHAFFSMLPHAGVAKGYKTQELPSVGYSHSSNYGTSTITLYAPVLEFSYKNRVYHALGAAQEESGLDSVKILFNTQDPSEARVFSFQGLLDFPLANKCFQLWLLASAGLYAFAATDDTFVIGNFTVKKLRLSYFLLLVIVISILPLFSCIDLWLFGKTTIGTIESETIRQYGENMRMVSYRVNQTSYMTHFDHTYALDVDVGDSIDVRYLPSHPQRAAVMMLSDMYSSAYLVVMGIVLVFITGWYYASQSITLGDTNS